VISSNARARLQETPVGIAEAVLGGEAFDAAAVAVEVGVRMVGSISSARVAGVPGMGEA
jgi:hypothetical protein